MSKLGLWGNITNLAEVVRCKGYVRLVSRTFMASEIDLNDSIVECNILLCFDGMR